MVELQARFEEEMSRLLHERNNIAFVVAAFFFPGFVFQDYHMVPERWEEMLVLRLTCSLVCILGMAVNKSPIGDNRPFAVTLAVALTLSLLKTYITPFEVAGSSSLYFAGHGMILVGALSFLPLSTKQAVIVGLTIHLGYSLPTIFLAVNLDPVVFLVQNTYLFSFWFILSIGVHLNYQMRFREFDLRWKLYSVRKRAEDYG